MIVAAESTTAPADRAGEWGRMRVITPRVYLCRRATGPINIDGRIDDAAWDRAAWTEDFVDIEGPHKSAPPRLRTRGKMLWDDEHLYVAAEMIEPHVVATLTEKNSVIYHDNDFEIFIDPDGDNHNYYEFEMNALNTIWELTLPRPYKDGGDPRLGTNVSGLRSAVSVKGTINDPRDEDASWSVEIAIPWSGLAPYNPGRATPPRAGDAWRMNFSRVEWQYDVIDGKYRRHARERSPEDNWVWSPTGIVDMHRPERWGFVWFVGDGSDAARIDAKPDPTLMARDVLMEAYYRQRVFRAESGQYARSLCELGFDSTCVVLRATDDGRGFVATTTATMPDGTQRTLHVREDSRIWSGEEGKR